MQRLLNQLDVYKPLNIRPPFMTSRTKDLQAFWMLFSVNTLCNQSDTPHNLHITSFGLGARVCFSLFDIIVNFTVQASVPVLYVWPISCQRWKCGRPLNNVRYDDDDDDDERWKRRRSNGLVRGRIYIVWKGEPGDVSMGWGEIRIGFV